MSNLFSSDETIREVMEGKFTDFSKEDRDYPDVKGTIQKVAFPKPQSTVASESMAKARKSKEEQVSIFLRL